MKKREEKKSQILLLTKAVLQSWKIRDEWSGIKRPSDYKDRLRRAVISKPMKVGGGLGSEQGLINSTVLKLF